MRYLLSTGESTNLPEYYIIDLFKLYLKIYPDDIPGASQVGFNFIFTNIKKNQILNEIRGRIDSLISKIKSKFSSNPNIEIVSLELIDETRVKLVISVNQVQSEEIEVDISDSNNNS